MAHSPADETADFLDAQHQNLAAYTPGLVQPSDPPGMVGHITVGVPAWLVLRLWEGLSTASRQLRTLASQYRGSQARVAELEQRCAAQAVRLDALSGTESTRLENLTRWASAFAEDHGLDVDGLHEAVRAQAEWDHDLWARLDRERVELEAFRIAVRSCVEQVRETGAEAKGLDARGVKVVLRALDRAYRTSRV
jgi:hypothetical protein